MNLGAMITALFRFRLNSWGMYQKVDFYGLKARQIGSTVQGFKHSIFTGLRIHLEERNMVMVPTAADGLIYHSKGFDPAVEIQDFPIRSKKVYLRIKRRRWVNQLTGDIIS